VAAAAAAVPAAWYAGMRSPLVRHGGDAGGEGPGAAPLVGHEAPSFVLPDPDGKPVELKQLRGRPVLLNFWATWCAPCKDELPEFEQVYREHKAGGLVVLAVSADDASTAKQVPAYLTAGSSPVGSYTFPVALDTNQEVVRRYKLFGLPATFFIDRTGIIRALHPGAMSRQMIEERLKSILPPAAGGASGSSGSRG
jgi:peroxiredoxin